MGNQNVGKFSSTGEKSRSWDAAPWLLDTLHTQPRDQCEGLSTREEGLRESVCVCPLARCA